MSRNIKILIVEDSKVIIQLLQVLLNEEPDFEVVGSASNGVEAIELTKKLKPDLITMDINMPELDGFQATKIIMNECPTPIVVISSYVDSAELNTTFNALTAGALTVIEKPHDIAEHGFEKNRKTLINTLRALSEVRVMRRRINIENAIVQESHDKLCLPKQIDLVALGASTGGPEALRFILSQLPCDYPVPIVIVQHITPSFLPGLITWLDRNSALNVKIASHNDSLEAGCVYFAPDHCHLTIKKGIKPIASLEDSESVGHFKPSITSLFDSIAHTYPTTVIAGLLTGMGSDGAQGLLAIKQVGGYTFIQDKLSSIVFGMPAAAQLLNAECAVYDLAVMPELLNTVINKGE